MCIFILDLPFVSDQKKKITKPRTETSLNRVFFQVWPFTYILLCVTSTVNHPMYHIPKSDTRRIRSDTLIDVSISWYSSDKVLKHITSRITECMYVVTRNMRALCGYKRRVYSHNYILKCTHNGQTIKLRAAISSIGCSPITIHRYYFV